MSHTVVFHQTAGERRLSTGTSASWQKPSTILRSMLRHDERFKVRELVSVRIRSRIRVRVGVQGHLSKYTSPRGLTLCSQRASSAHVRRS